MFQRAKAMNSKTWSEGAEVLKLYADLNGLLGKPTYSNADKKKIIALLKKLGIEKSDDGELVILRQNRGHLIKRGKKGIEVVANGRNDWIGWLDLEVEEVSETATRNTGQVIRDIGADVLGIVEAESRPALLRFSNNILKAVAGKPFDHVMLIDGNDERGIDVAIMTRKDYNIVSIRSHVDDADNVGLIFSRDCAEYTVETPKGNRLVLLINHFKSKGFGSQVTSNTKRERQTKRVKEIYEDLQAKGAKFVAILGDFNDTPDSAPLAPLIKNTNLKDISLHTAFDDGGRPGTFGTGAKSNKIDYILMSPDLFTKTTKGGIFRKGVWGGINGNMWPHYPEMKQASDAASDHAAIWAEIDL
jgi:endonuclease/exonuclease/phosphatase family metal-dependent hydrolase